MNICSEVQDRHVEGGAYQKNWGLLLWGKQKKYAAKSWLEVLSVRQALLLPEIIYYRFPPFCGTNVWVRGMESGIKIAA